MAEVIGSDGTETFDIHGVRLAISTNAGWVREGVEKMLGAFRSPIAHADAAMYLRAGSGLAADRHDSCHDARWDEGIAPALAAARTEFRHGSMGCFRSAGRLVYSDGRSTVSVDLERAQAEGTLCRSETGGDATAWSPRQQPVFTFALLELLRHQGLYHLHAAGLERDGQGILLAGDSGSGKSTLAWLLARAGWGFLSDDTLLLRLIPGGVEARGWPAPFHMDRALGALFPELERLRDARPYNSGSKRELRVEESLSRGFSASAQPRLLLFPHIHRSPEPPRAEPVAPGVWLRPLPPGQAVAELIRSSALVLLDARAAKGHLESLRLVAMTCDAYRLYHGPAALEAPDGFVRLAESLSGV
jgi:hypothetical protein